MTSVSWTTHFTVAAGLAVASLASPAAAVPMNSPHHIAPTATLAETVQYYGYGRPYRGGYYGYGYGYGYRPYYRPYYAPPPPPVTYYESRPYVARPAPRGYDPDAVARCASQFRSFNVRTGTYITYGGEEVLCPYLR